MQKVAVYTCVTNNYDSLKPIKNEPGLDYYVFTDDKDLKVEGWKTIHTKDPQRKIKILGHDKLKDYDVTVYMDASFELKGQISQLLKQFRGGFLTVKHPKRSCVYAEAQEVIRQGKADKAKVIAQVRRYERVIGRNAGMWATGLMVRSNIQAVHDFCKIWYAELEQHTHRDQLSIVWAIHKTGRAPMTMTWAVLRQMFHIHPHRMDRNPTVHYISPYRADRNIGKANNDEIEKYALNDWVCVTDADALFLLPDFGTKIVEIINLHGEDFGLIGCMTNRLGGLHQCYKGKFSEDMDVRNHYGIAKELWEENGANVEETKGVAGLFMLFKVDTWRRAGGFREHELSADTYFNKAVKKLGMKIGLAKGMYMFHSYRIWQEGHAAAWGDTNHLK